MSLTAGTITLVAVQATTAQLTATVATGGTGPYTYQWYRSTTTGFTPAGGNLISGATALSLNDTGLTPNTIWYYKVVATDTGNSNVTVEYTQVVATTSGAVLNPNQFDQTMVAGVVDLRFPYNTVSVQIDASQSGSLYGGNLVKLVDSADGIPKVIGITANTDEVFGMINFDTKTVAWTAGMPAELSMSGNCVWLYATGAIARGAQVVPDYLSPAGVKSSSGQTGQRIIGWAYDKSTAAGQLIRVFLRTPSFTVV